MTEDETAPEGGDQLPFARPYDYFKHLTGVALLSIGGVLAFMDGGAIKFDAVQGTIILAALGIAGVISLLMAGGLAALEVRPVPHAKMARQVRANLIAATFFLAMGLGGFVSNFASAIFK